MLQPEVYLTKSATEVLRTVSVVTGKDIVPANFFKKPDQMDDVLGHLIALYFDSPSVPSRRGELLCLANTIVTELKIPINIRVEDFSDERDRKKWLTFFSHVIRFLEDSTKFEPGVALYAEVTKAKIKYAELLEAVKNKEEEIGLRQGERQAKQKVVDQLGDVVSHLSEKLRQLKANRSSLEKEVNALRSRKSRAVENIQRLVPEVENLMEECDKTNAMILQDIDKLPSSIASLKEDLFAVEAEMHSLFEKRTSIVDRTSTFQHYESMLEQLKSSVNQINILMREFSEAKKEEELAKKEHDDTADEHNRVSQEVAVCEQSAVEMQHQVTKLKLLLAQKKKAFQVSQKEEAKKTVAIKADMRKARHKLADLQHRCSVVEEQIKTEREEADEYSKQLAELGQLCPILAEINSEVAGGILKSDLAHDC